jgi:hypothetical protein
MELSNTALAIETEDEESKTTWVPIRTPLKKVELESKPEPKIEEDLRFVFIP